MNVDMMEICSTECIKEEAIPVDGNVTTEDDTKPESSDLEGEYVYRIQVKNLPRYSSPKMVKNLLSKNLETFTFKKLRFLNDRVYFSLKTTKVAADSIVKLLDGSNVKGSSISAKIVPNCQSIFTKKSEPKLVELENLHAKTAREAVTPLADLEYSKQLELKMETSRKIVRKLLNALRKANVRKDHLLCADVIQQTIRPSPLIRHYRNKCEFTIGRTLDKKICVGFVGGRFVDNQHFVIPVDTCDNITLQMQRIVKSFERFVIETSEPPFDESERKGFWRMLTIREFGFDVMLIATVYPLGDHEREISLKKSFKESFLQLETVTDPNRGFRITSVYWQRLVNASDETVYEHIGGVPYIYATILNKHFRISPASFFQTNTSAINVLYTVIAERCGFIEIRKEKETNIELFELAEDEIKECRDDDGASLRKKCKINESDEQENIKLVLDICCGTGSIGISLLELSKLKGRRYIVGVECVEEAVEDANVNAIFNGFTNDEFKFVCAKAEDVLPKIHQYIPNAFDLNSVEIIGIVDPPRAGVHKRVLQCCRKLPTLRQLIFVSCQPTAAVANLVDLCRPESNRYEGEPFHIESITPVDMFPQTNHFEWVVHLRR